MNDKLSQVLNRFNITAGVFYSGNICGLSAFDESPKQEGHLHILYDGEVEVHTADNQRYKIDEPTLIFHPKPGAHRLYGDLGMGANLVCATLSYGVNANNILTSALPHLLNVPLKDSPRLHQVSQWISNEAFADIEGKLVVMNRLCELLLIELFRYLIETSSLKGGVFAGLSHPKISAVLNAIHERQHENWNLDKMAEIANLSRSKFAELFKEVVDQTPADYVTEWRLGIAQELLKKGKPVGLVANEVGYEDGSALAKVFKKKIGVSPKDWAKQFN